MEERKPRKDEQLSTHRKKFQYVAIGAFGLLFAIFGGNFLLDKVTDKKTAIPSEDTGEGADKRLQTGDVRQSLLQARQPENGSSSVPDTGRSPTNEQQPDGQKRRSPYTSGTAENSTRSTSAKDPLQDVEEKFRVTELSRALQSRVPGRTGSGGGAVTRTGDPFAAPEQYQTTQQSNADRIREAEARSADVDAQLEQARSRLASRRQEGNSNIQAAEKRIAQARRDVAALTGENPASALSTGSQSVTAPPANVVGWSKDNPYQASTEGMLKLPVGTLLNAITTMTAISDYQGGSMKAMLTEDVYDATNSYILAPKGSEFIIQVVKASSVNEVIQNRMAFAVKWLVLPDGNRIDFSRASGLDRMGIPAVKGTTVDRHILAQILGVTAYAIVGSRSSYAGTGNSESSMAGDIGDGLRGQTRNAVSKYLQIVPTVELHAGTPVRIFTEDEIFVYPWDSVYGDKYYE